MIVIPDEYGGYTHSAGYHIINPDGKLVAIFGMEQMDELRAYLNQALEGRIMRLKIKPEWLLLAAFIILTLPRCSAFWNRAW